MHGPPLFTWFETTPQDDKKRFYAKKHEKKKAPVIPVQGRRWISIDERCLFRDDPLRVDKHGNRHLPKKKNQTSKIN